MSSPDSAAPQLDLRRRLTLYWEISRPRVLLLVLFTGLPVLAMGRSGWPGLVQAFWVLFGTALAGAASSALNAYVERESDAKMARTRERPLPAAVMAPREALHFGLLLSVLSTIVLHLSGGWMAALVGVLSILFYVFVYTLYLKPRTPQNIVIGGAAGATTPLIADAAIDGQLSAAGWILFLIIFLWTPPHFWAVALYRKDDYANAGIPMMPNVVGDQGTRWRMLAYTLVLIPVTLAPWYIELLSWMYAAVAVGVGLWFLYWNIKVIRAESYTVDRGMFRASIAYLFILYGAMLLDLTVLV